MPTGGGGATYTGTAVLSTGKTISSAGHVTAVYAGAATLSRHPSVAATSQYAPRKSWITSRRLSKPIPGTQIDWSHPLASGLVGLWPLNEGSGVPINLASNQPAVSNSMAWASSQRGIVPSNPSGAASYVRSQGSGTQLSVTGTQLSFGAWLYTTRASGSYQLLMSLNNGSGSANRQYGLYLNTSGTSQVYVDIASQHVAVNLAIPWTVGSWFHILVTVNQATISIYINGRLSGTAASIGSLTSLVSTSLYFGYDAGAANFALFGSIDLPAVWNRCLSSQDAANLYANPWQIFQPHRLVITPTPPVWSGTATMTASHATASMAGTAAAATYSGRATISRHPAISSSATSSPPAYAGTAAVSRHPSVAASGVFGTVIYTGSASVSRHPSAISTGTTSPPAYGGSASVSRHPAISATGTSVPVGYAGAASVSRHPTISTAGTAAPPVYSGRATLSRHPAVTSSGTLAGTYTGSASLSRHPNFASAQVLVFTGTASLTIRHPLIPVSTLLSLYYPMDTITSGLSPDAMEEHDGTVSGDVSPSTTVPATLFPDPGSYAFNQTGTNGQIQLSYALGNSWTIAVWLRPTSLATTGAIATNDQGNGLYAFNGSLAYRSAGTMFTMAALTANTWQHVAISYFFGQVTAFLNGAFAGSPAVGTFTLTNIGSNSGGQAFQGLMDDFRYYPTNLTTQQVQSLYQGKQDTPNMSGVFAYRTSGTATLSRHPNISSAAVYYTYLGAMTTSRHPTLAAAATGAVPIYSGTATLSRHPAFASTARSAAYVGVSSLAVRHPTFAGTATSALPSARAAMNCFLKAEPIPTFGGSVTLMAVGCSVTASGGGFATRTLYASGKDNPPYARLNLWAGGYQPPLWVSAVLNLSAESGYPVADGSVPLYAENLASAATAYTTLYAEGQGVTAGAVPASASMNMAVQRGPYAGITLFLQQNGAAVTLPMFAIGSPLKTASVPLFAIGFGGDAVATVTLVVPLASTSTAAANQVTLAAPDVVGTAAGTQLLYTQGWRS